MKGQYTHTVEKILRYLRLITLLVSLFILYSIYNDMQENKSFQRQMICEWFGLDQAQAPNFCK